MGGREAFDRGEKGPVGFRGLRLQILCDPQLVELIGSGQRKQCWKRRGERKDIRRIDVEERPYTEMITHTGEAARGRIPASESEVADQLPQTCSTFEVEDPL